MIRFDIRKSENLVFTTLSARVDDEELLSSYRSLYADPDWRPGMDEIADLRDADMSGVTTEGLHRLAGLSERFHEPATRVPRSAAIVSRDVTFGIVRMYEAFAHRSPETVQLFKSRAEALAWLGRPEPASTWDTDPASG